MRNTKKEYSDEAKGFSIPSKAYYAASIGYQPPHIMIGFYYDEGCEGEFKIVWDGIGIQLQAYNDAWEALSKMPELINLLAKIDMEGKEPTVDEFAELLEEIGYKDLTEYTK